MDDDLRKLVELQRVETELKRVEAQVAQLPGERTILEQALTKERARLDVARNELGESQKKRRQLEGDLQDLESKRSKYKGQLMDVKTNKEYTAMLHEIEATDREIRSREDLVLVEMEKAEEQQAFLKEEERVVKAAEERDRNERAALDERERTLQAQAAKLREERDAKASSISEGPLELFRRIASFRGVAVAEARDERCEVCHVKLRYQFWVELKRNEAVVQCPACNRILFYEPVPATIAPGP